MELCAFITWQLHCYNSTQRRIQTVKKSAAELLKNSREAENSASSTDNLEDESLEGELSGDIFDPELDDPFEVNNNHESQLGLGDDWEDLWRFKHQQVQVPHRHAYHGVLGGRDRLYALL